MLTNSRIYRLFVMTLMMFAIPCSLFSQATEGVIFGTVTDSSAAVVPNATVIVKSVERGIERTTVTNGDGNYSMPNLDLGSYIVTVEAPGFKRTSNPPATITVKAQIRIDTTLEVGKAGETVEVTSAPPIIKTSTAEVNNLITRDELQNLPVMSRNIVALASLTAGTNGGLSSGRQAQISGAALVVGGAPAEGNNFIIDGVSNNMEFSGTLSITPPIDAIQEFAVQTSQYSAEFGRSAGGVINFALKSGTNQVHGFAYDYIQNDIFNARNFDFTGANLPKQPVRRNQFGAGAGGPLIRNRAFWFGDYEGVRHPSSSISQTIVPTASEKNGDFSSSGYTIYDPATLHADPQKPGSTVRDPFPGNVIPQSRISAAGSGLVNYYPNPNFVSPNANIRTNYLTQLRARDTSNLYNIKGDVVVNDLSSVAAHYSHQQRIQSTDGWLPDGRISSSTSLNGDNAGLNYTRVLNPNVVTEVRASYNRTDMPVVLENHENVLDPYNIPGWNTNVFGRGFPTISLTNISGAAPTRQGPFGPPFRLAENTYQLLDTTSWQWGNHSIKFGGGVDNQRLSRYQARSGGGSLTFNGTYTTATPGAAVSVPRTGVPDMLLGLSSNLLTQYGFDAIRIYNYRVNGFIQDDWHVTHNLTLNLGLRYDFFRPYHEEQDRIANFDLATGIRLVPESARKVVQNTLGLPNGDLPPGWAYAPLDKVIPHANWRDFSPRLGVAYAVNKNLVLRGGWGIYYSLTSSNSFNNSGTEGNPFFFDFTVQGDASTPVKLTDGFPSGGIWNVLASPSFGAYYGPLDRGTPYAQKYSATIEWSPLKNTAVSAGYVGQTTFNFPTLASGNQAQVPAATPVISRQPYPNVGFFWMYLTAADSNYNAMTISVKQRYTHGFSLQSSFTWSKALGYDTGTDQTLTNRWDLNYDYGPVDYDIRQRWLTSFIYQEPKFSSLPAIARWTLGDWSFSGILTLQSGSPFTVTASGAVTNTGSGGGTGNRPDVVGNATLSSGERTVNRWFNTSAFKLPASYTWGNAGKNILYGPGLTNLDFALQKSFVVFREDHRVTFRMEATNLTNHVNPGNPAANLSGANFGVITGLKSGPRQMQAALRYDF